MAYRISYMMTVDFVPDGAGPLSVPSAQRLILGQIVMQGLTVNNPTISNPGQPQGYQAVTGGDSPQQSDFNTALNGSSATPAGGMALDLSNAIAADLARIQGFATGGG
jgi:hypothetical protein